MSFGWPQTLSLLILNGLTCLSLLPTIKAQSVWTPALKLRALNQTKQLWYHGFDNYMQHAFPADELRPLSCTGRGPDWKHP